MPFNLPDSVRSNENIHCDGENDTEMKEVRSDLKFILGQLDRALQKVSSKIQVYLIKINSFGSCKMAFLEDHSALHGDYIVDLDTE